ncbi:MAG: 30S ribosomal protein S12 methylthiotransferase RimO [Pirellulaceae bacterium]|nr:30S ribosomal protein S12 methylthiotransferase RimO [Pirellulaceae bacterium]
MNSSSQQTSQAPTEVKGTYTFVSLGCPKNTVDSEKMLGLLGQSGYGYEANPAHADLAIINTCGFIDAARKESCAVIEEMLDLKQDGQLQGVVVAGGLAERHREDLIEAYPHIYHRVGVFSRDEIVGVADQILANGPKKRFYFEPAPIRALSDIQRSRITPNHYAYLKISEGCDRLCTFCAIPKMRGKHASKTIEQVVLEAKELADSGVRELILVAQDTTYYGKDIYGQPRLAELLKELEKVDGVEWIRLMYFYPMYLSDDLIKVIKESPKIIPYIDMPLQHIDETMLRRMARRVTQEETVTLVRKLRKEIPGLVLRTTFIAGFPGETDETIAQLTNFIREQRFERMGVFTYSLEGDTPAARLADHRSDADKERWREELMSLQQEITFERAASLIGTTQKMIVDHQLPEEENVWIARTTADAPAIDGVVYLTGERLSAGCFVEGEIVQAQGYDLVAVALGEPDRPKMKQGAQLPIL